MKKLQISSMSSQFILVRHSSIQKEVKPLQINIYKDKMPGACLFGASVLYSAKPIPREDVPQGWYCYDLRGTARHPDDPMRWWIWQRKTMPARSSPICR